MAGTRARIPAIVALTPFPTIRTGKPTMTTATPPPDVPDPVGAQRDIALPDTDHSPAQVLRNRLNAARQRIRAARERQYLDNETANESDEDDARDANLAVPYGLRVTAAWGWRMLILAAVAWVLLWLIGRLSAVLIPLVIALLLTAILAPPVRILRTRLKLPPSLATAIVLVGGVLVLAGALTLLITQIVQGAPELAEKSTAGVGEIRDWLRDGPLHLSTAQLDNALEASGTWLQDNRESLTSGALATATAGVEAFISAILILFVTFFFLRDGRRLWRFTMVLVPRKARKPLMEAGHAGWLTLVAYVRATVIVAFIDAIGIGIALLVLRVDFAFVLIALVFLSAFIPVVGATVSGSVAVLIALVDEGPVTALILLAAVIAVQQLEGHVLQPLIMGRAVSIHPLAVIIALAVGVVVAGVIGALVAVPVVAVLNTAIRHLHHRGRQPGPDAVVVSSDPTP